MSLDQQILDLAVRYRPLTADLLAELIRVPADWVDRPQEEGGDSRCGISNHEGPRLELLARRIVELGAVASATDVATDPFGNLVWTVSDPEDGIRPEDKAVIYFDGHCDTVRALRQRWRELGGVDAYDGLLEAEALDWGRLEAELGYLPPEGEREHLIFGRGSADQLSGVAAQVVACKIMLQLRVAGALRGSIVRCMATVCEEENDGAGPMHLMREQLPGASPDRVPDVVILSEGTGHAELGACGIYRGQRGRIMIEVEVTGRSCHGSMPWEGLNPLEFGAAIIGEAAAQCERGEGFLDHEFLGHGTRTASWSVLETPSDCAVPDRFTFRLDRRLTVGESPEQALADVSQLASVARACAAGLRVEVRVPVYDQPTWKGTVAGNRQVYASWVTPEEHPAIQTAVDAYCRVVTPQVERDGSGGALRRQPRLGRWIFSTDGVGFPVPVGDASIAVPARKDWVTSGDCIHPAMLGFGPGIEQNTHKIGECVDRRELPVVVALFARFPSLFAQAKGI
jgi:putative selenium metabolism hydrolase